MPKSLAALFTLLLIAVTVAGQSAKQPAFDTILRHGTILDGTGLKPYKADLGIHNGYVAEIGDLSNRKGTLDLDVTGLYVAPGFISIHSHAQNAALPTAINMLTQGVTTEIVNADGGGSADITKQLANSGSAGFGVNLGADIGFNSVWAEVVGMNDRRPTPEEFTKMRAIVERNLQQGAWGVTSGLDYLPGNFAHTDEITKVVSVAAPWRTHYPSHERITRESGFSSKAGEGETIKVGSDSGMVPVLTHMKVWGAEQGSAADLIAMEYQANAAGHYTAADVYPYLSGQTGLGAMTIPGWAMAGGYEEEKKRFKDPEMRAKIAENIEAVVNGRFGGPPGVYLPDTKQQLTDIMRDRHIPAGEAVIQVLEKGNVSAVIKIAREDDLVKILKDPLTAISCDCGSSLNGTHPRYYGSWPKVLGHYVRETHTLTWEDTVRKMSGLPANTIGMVDRGFLVPGMRADITVFNPETVIDHATYENPQLLSEGIQYVLVNGKLEIRDGKRTAEKGGSAILRTSHMPSRPMSINQARRISWTGTAEGLRIAFDISQAAGADHPTGSFRLTDAKTGTTIQTTTIGLLQTTANWATFACRARTLPDGEEKSIIVITDLADPFATAHASTISVDMEGAYHVAVSVEPGRIKLSRP
jgi:N-acyl-D-amino-acid deacylase